MRVCDYPHALFILGKFFNNPLANWGDAMPRKEETKSGFKTISASVSKELDKMIAEIAKQSNRTKSEIIRAALNDYISRN